MNTGSQKPIPYSWKFLRDETFTNFASDDSFMKISYKISRVKTSCEIKGGSQEKATMMLFPIIINDNVMCWDTAQQVTMLLTYYILIILMCYCF